LLVFGALALLGLAVMAAVAVYAFAERSNAQHQAALAEEQKVEAEKQKTVAEDKTQQLQVSNKKLKQAQHRAQANAARYNVARLNALKQEARAEGNRRRALRLAAAEVAARTSAERLAVRFRKERNRAVSAEAATDRQRRLGRARELLASSRSLLDQDPTASVRAALAAAAAFRRAGRSPSVGVEDALRDGLLALRLKAVLRGGGAVRTASFSPDGSLALVAGRGGTSLFNVKSVARRLNVVGPPRPRRLASSPVGAATFSPDGRLVAAAGTGSDHTVHVWDVQSGAVVATLQHPEAVLTVAFSPDNRLLATGSTDGNARVWSVAAWLPLASFSHESGSRGDNVREVSFSPDSTRLLTVGSDRFARIFDLTNRGRNLRLNNVTLVNAATFSHDGGLVATGGAANTTGDSLVRVWDARTGAEKEPFRTTGSTTTLAFSPDDSMLAAAGNVGATARIWRRAGRDLLAVITGHRSGVESVAFSPDGGSVLTTGRDGKVFISGTEGGFTKALLLGHRGSVLTGAFSPNGQLVVTASADGTARVWDADVDLTGPAPPGIPHLLGDHDAPVNAVAFSPDGSTVLSVGDDGTARLWRGRTVVTLRHGGPVTSASFNKTGSVVITGSADGNGRIWRTTGAQIVTLPQGQAVTAVQLSPNGRIAVTAGRNGSARLWNAATGALLHSLPHKGPVNDARFSREGKLLVTASDDGTAAIWRVADGKQLFRLSGHSDDVLKAAFSPDGRYVATASADATARIWSAKTGQIVRRLSEHSDSVTALAFSPNSRQLATASADRDARVWNVRTGAPLALLRIHVSTVNDVAYSADGRWIATAGPTAAAIWKTKASGRWQTLPVYIVRGPFTRPLNAVAFSALGWRLVMGSRDGSVRTYDCRLCGGLKQLVPIAQARLREIVTAKP
jgi:WD40 repeat protein